MTVTVLKIVLIILVTVCVLLATVFMLPAKITVRYSESAEVYAGLGFLKFRLYPGKKKQKDGNAESAKEEIKKDENQAGRKNGDSGQSPDKKDGSDKKSTKQESENKKGSVSDMLNFVLDAVKSILNLLGNKAKITVNRLTVVVAKENAADTAIQFGICCGIVSSALAFCSNFKKCKINDDNVGVYPDFVSGKGSVEADISLQASLFSIAVCAVKILLKKPF